MTFPAGDDFRVSVAETPRALVITATGELDTNTAPELTEHLDRTTSESGPVILDMTGVTFCDSSGLNTLLAAVSRGVDVRIVGSRRVLKVLDLAGVTQSLRLETSVTDAINATTPRQLGQL